MTDADGPTDDDAASGPAFDGPTWPGGDVDEDHDTSQHTPQSEQGEDELAVADALAGRDDAASAAARAGELDLPAPPLAMLLESVLLVTDTPVPAVTLAQVVEQPTGEVEAELTRLSHAYTAAGSGFDLRQVAGGWRLYTRAECAPWVERFVQDGQPARLTQAALETLAVVAYRQPVTRARVSAVRGVNVDGVVRSLLARGLLAEAGTDAETGGTLYVTTGLLLEKLGVQSIDDLPSLAPLLPELDEFEQDSMST